MVTYNRKYDNGEITVFWQPQKCGHVAACVRALPNVFRPAKRPWVDMRAASTTEIMQAVRKCPTGALTFTFNEDNPDGDYPEWIESEKRAGFKFGNQ